MNFKFALSFLLLITIQHICQAGRLPRDAHTEESSSSEEEIHTNLVKSASDSSEDFTDKDVEKLAKELDGALPAADVQQLKSILTKFTKGASPERQAEGLVDLLVFALSGSPKQNTDFTEFNDPKETVTTVNIPVLREKTA